MTIDGSALLKYMWHSLVTVLGICSLAFLTNRPAVADPMVIFSVTGMFFNGERLGTGSTGVSLSVTGVDTPLRYGVTVHAGPGGFAWLALVDSEDANNWYFTSLFYGIIIESQFNFYPTLPGQDLSPGNISI